MQLRFIKLFLNLINLQSFRKTKIITQFQIDLVETIRLKSKNNLVKMRINLY